MRVQQEKTVTLENKEFLVRKFSPETGCYWATRLFGDLLGALGSGSGTMQQRLPKLIQDFTRMDKAEFVNFQRDCLSFVFVKLDSGLHSLVDSNTGYLTVPGLGSPTLMALTLHSFMFTMIDFLDQSLLETILGAVPEDLLETGDNGSTTSSTPLSDLNTGTKKTSGTANTPPQIFSEYLT